MTSETVHLDGPIIDSQTLSRVLDLILLHGGSYEITQFSIGTKREEPSHAEIVVQADDSEAADHPNEYGQHSWAAHGADPMVG